DRDPLDVLGRGMLEHKMIEAAEIEALRERMKAAMRQAVEALTEPDPADKAGRLRIRPELWPDPKFRDVGLRGDLSELEGARTAEQAQFQGRLEEKKFVDVVADVMDRRMSTDPRIVVMGEDVHRLKGGTNGATRG